MGQKRALLDVSSTLFGKGRKFFSKFGAETNDPGEGQVKQELQNHLFPNQSSCAIILCCIGQIQPGFAQTV